MAGSAYLVEPVPPCSGLADVWRHVLQKRPHQTIAVMTVLLRQMIAITRQLASWAAILAVPLGLPATWASGRWIRSLMDQARIGRAA